MKNFRPLSAVLALVFVGWSGAIDGAETEAQSSALGWPAITRESKPWTRWWWPGSGVDKASLTAQLEQMASAGIGGVEITPIYGAKGYEDRYIDFLSPKWMEMLEHVGREGERLGIGVDMATGTGWPFGGPWVEAESASVRVALKDGKLVGEPTRMKVKRAAPGGEGLVVDPYSTESLRRYLAPFDKAFASFPRGLVRGQFHDSFEYYNASWTPAFEATFREMHGYDIQQFAAELLARPGNVTTVDRETLARIKSDYRDTLAKLHLDYLRTWVEWSHEHGFVVRNQSHGAPGNLLDLYANADIAETEGFGSTPFPIPGLRRLDDEVRHGQDLPESLVIRMASSAGHVAGHNLSSSESLTWLRDHFKEAPSYTKPELDRLLTDGINHIFYHGTVFSPADAAWPGWLFYAATQVNPNNPLWEDFGAVNQYIGRVQSVLQSGKPDNDILLYWPVEDVWDKADGLMIQLTVHNVSWLTEAPVGKLARAFIDRGYSFDYISDAQLQQTRAEDGSLATAGGRYKVIVVPATRRMPVATLARLVQLQKEGAKVIFEKLPEDVPGYGRLEERRGEFKAALAQVNTDAVQSDVLGALAAMSVPREAIAETGVRFIRRASEGGHDYFFANLTAKQFDGWVTLGTAAEAASILDPLSGAAGAAALRAGNGSTEIYLQIASGQSMIVRTRPIAWQTIKLPRTEASGAPSQGNGETLTTWMYVAPVGAPVALDGTWRIEFVKGGPELPPAIESSELKSWTELGGDEAKRFAGTARYRIEFEAPVAAAGATSADDWMLNLGDVREVARVRLNDLEVATAWSLPFEVRVGEFLKPGRNVLELDVTNLAANRIRDLDQRKVEWKIMREINFVNINYKPFDASGWGLQPSGLLGPVTLTPLKALSP